MSNFTSIYKAIIHDLNDPEKRGRARLLVPAVLGRSVSGWAATVMDVDASLVLPPKAGEQVWVFFENGDLNRPTWIRAQVVTAFPTGASMKWHTTTPPAGWLLEDNGEYPIATYTALYNILTTNGTVFPHGANTNGAGGAGTTHFRTPNSKGKAPVGYDSTQTEFNAIGKTGGAKTHTLTLAEIAAHTHVQDAHNHTQDAHNHTQNSHNHTQNAHSHGGATGTQSANHTHNYAVGWSELATANWDANFGSGLAFNRASTQTSGIENQNHTHAVTSEAATNQATTATNIATTATNIAATATNQNSGGGAAHNNLQPYTVVNWIIKT